MLQESEERRPRPPGLPQRQALPQRRHLPRIPRHRCPGLVDDRRLFHAGTRGPFSPPRRPANVAPDSGPLKSWVVDILPYIDANDLANAWNHDTGYLSTSSDSASPSNLAICTKAIGVLTCPDDLTVQPGQGNLSYVVNVGFSRWVGNPASAGPGR